VKQVACCGVVLGFDAINIQKSCQQIIDSQNHYLGALKNDAPWFESQRFAPNSKGSMKLLVELRRATTFLRSKYRTKDVEIAQSQTHWTRMD
jgi:hypothetical protein